MLTIVVASCQPTYVKTYSWAYPVAGDWAVKAYVDGAEAGGPYEIRTYNSAFGKDSIFVDDYATTSSNGNFWGFHAKAAVDMTAKTFQTALSTNAVPSYGIGVKIMNGKIIGTDSISFEIQFSDDTNTAGVGYATTYTLAGHREVGYDEYVQK